jgi:hypothetical protein
MSPGIHHAYPTDRSILAAITTWAQHADARILWLFLAMVLPGVMILLLTGWQRWPFSTPFFTLGAIGAWGLLERRVQADRSRLASVVESCLLGLGMLMAFLTGLGLLLWVMGPAPIL